MSAEGPTFTVPLSPGSRLHFSWGLGTELRLLDVQDPATQQGGDGGLATLVSWGQVSNSERIISFGTAEQYADVQRSKLAGTRDDAHLARVASYARAVREQLMSMRDDTDDGLSQLEAALWQLLEVFFVDAPRNDGNLGEDFVHWLAAHHDGLATLTAQPTLSGRIQELRQDPSADAQPDYWPLIRRLVALGRTAEALELLDCHDVKRLVVVGGRGAGAVALQQPGIRAQLELLDCLHVLLKRLPRLAPSSGRDPTSRAYSSLVEFTAARSVWLREARDIADSEQLFAAAAAASKRTAEGVRAVLSVLLGQPAALRAATADWLEGAAAEIVHRQAGGVVAANQLRALLSEVRATRGSSESSNGLLDLLARLLEALTETDTAGVVSVLSTSGVASAWLMAHSLELLAAYPGGAAAAAAAAGNAAGTRGEDGGGGAGGGPLLTRPLAISGCDQMEYFRLAWAETLLPSCLSGGWQLALQYLAWCPQHGAAAAEALMEALPVDSRDVRGLEKALAACRRLGLGAAAAVLCRVAGVDALSRGQLGGGVQWMVRAADPRRTSAALQIVAAAVEESLLARLGTYRAGPLPLPGGEELETLLEWLPGGGCAAESSGAAAAAEGGEGEAAGWSDGAAAAAAAAGRGRRGVTGFLVELLRLSRAMGTLAAARDANAAPEDTAIYGSLAAGRSALMALVRSRTAPRRLCLPLLFYAIPLFEASPTSAAGVPLFTSQDIQQLLQWASECAGAMNAAAAAGAGGVVGGAPLQGGAAAGAAAAGLTSLAAALRVPPQYGRDVALALVRGMARSHVLEFSRGTAAAAAAAGDGRTGPALTAPAAALEAPEPLRGVGWGTGAGLLASLPQRPLLLLQG